VAAETDKEFIVFVVEKFVDGYGSASDVSLDELKTQFYRKQKSLLRDVLNLMRGNPNESRGRNSLVKESQVFCDAVMDRHFSNLGIISPSSELRLAVYNAMINQ